MSTQTVTSSSPQTIDSTPKAALLMIGASVCFVFMNTLAKTLSTQIPSQEVAFFRSLVNFLVLLPIILHQRRPLMGNNRKVMFIRSALGYISLYFAFYSMSTGLLAESTILIKTSIIFSALFSAMFLQEKISAKIFATSLVGFIGAALIIKPDPNQLVSTAGIAALLSGIIIGMIAVTLRKLQQTDDSLSIVFAFSMWGSLLGAIASAPTFVVPNYQQTIILVATGLTGLVAQYLFTESFKFGPASVIHPFMYSEIIFALAIGNIFFNESVGAGTIVGALLIIGAGIAILKIKAKTNTRKNPIEPILKDLSDP